jgi:hypothetical protein
MVIAFILESNTARNSTSVLMDGEPYQTFEKHLKSTLQELPIIYKLDLVALSHINNDHITRSFGGNQRSKRKWKKRISKSIQ